ncbi:hypothetical protein M2418_001925 [Rhizobium sp. BIGb0125]|uniref:hypothetical protein n=1 Tax=Rhizobium sp. BIGb0125 TaxID=2940618 RepID=UPI002168A8AA|nr:hypothetical protein [Rhizobium sp. BIGb0125]MCS4242399.1 hypothetical protein [Rhizobium sp. BIGb0125]
MGRPTLQNVRKAIQQPAANDHNTPIHLLAHNPIAYVAFTQSGPLCQIEKHQVSRVKDADSGNLPFIKYPECKTQEMPVK